MSIDDTRATVGHGLPESWGAPPGTPMSDERARWVRENVERANRSPATLLRRLRAAQARSLEEARDAAMDKGLRELARSLGEAARAVRFGRRDP